MSTPTVSIVLPTFNGARYLPQSIESCLTQTFADFELIVVDDASMDATPEIVATYQRQDTRVRNIRHATNRRLPAGLNTGFGAARGEYFTWTSHDNAYRTTALERLVEQLRCHPTIDLVYSQFSIMNASGKRIGDGWAAPPEGLPARNVVGACFLYRRHVHEALGGYDESMELVEDYDFWLRAYERFRLSFVPADLYLLREHDERLTRTRRKAVAHAHERAVRRTLARLTISRDVRREALLRLVKVALVRGSRVAAARYVCRLVAGDPGSLARVPADLWDKIVLPQSWQKARAKRRWTRQVARAQREIRALVGPNESVLLVDDDQIASTFGIWTVPFPEVGGAYAGPPEDDAAALTELERVRAERNPAVIAFAWPAFWWLEHYTGFASYLRDHWRCVLRNGRLVVFDLRKTPDCITKKREACSDEKRTLGSW